MYYKNSKLQLIISKLLKRLFDILELPLLFWLGYSLSSVITLFIIIISSSSSIIIAQLAEF